MSFFRYIVGLCLLIPCLVCLQESQPTHMALISTLLLSPSHCDRLLPSPLPPMASSLRVDMRGKLRQQGVSSLVLHSSCQPCDGLWRYATIQCYAVGEEPLMSSWRNTTGILRTTGGGFREAMSPMMDGRLALMTYRISGQRAVEIILPATMSFGSVASWQCLWRPVVEASTDQVVVSPVPARMEPSGSSFGPIAFLFSIQVLLRKTLGHVFYFFFLQGPMCNILYATSLK